MFEFEMSGLKHTRVVEQREFPSLFKTAVAEFARRVQERDPNFTVVVEPGIRTNSAVVNVMFGGKRHQAFEVSYNTATKTVSTISVYGDW